MREIVICFMYVNILNMSMLAFQDDIEYSFINTIKYMRTTLLTLMKYVRTNSQMTVVMPRRARPLPTLRTVFCRENFLARPSTLMMNFNP